MATVELRVDDFEDGVLPQVCASSGRATTSVYWFRASRRAWWPLLLLVGGPVGVVAMVVVMALLSAHISGWIPLDERAHQAMRAARRRAIRHLLEVGVVIAGVAALLVWQRWIVALVVALALGALAIGWCLAAIFRPTGSVGVRWASSGRTVVITDAASEFVAAYKAQESRRIRRRFDDIAEHQR